MGKSNRLWNVTLITLAGIAALQEGALRAQSQADVSRQVVAIGYTVGGGSTNIDLVPLDLNPSAKGKAKVEAKKGITNIEVEVENLAQPGKPSTEFLTYVLWAVSPDGQTNNLGELVIDKDGKAKLKATTQLQTFSLFVTAEPYFAVRHPSEVLVLENDTRKNTRGKIFPIKDYKLMRRTQYEKLGNPLALSIDLKTAPLEMYEARNAVDIAKSRGADKYAPEIFTKADNSLKMAENQLARKVDKKDIISTARQAVQFSEDARVLGAERQEQERIDREKAEAAAKAKAEAEAKAAAEAAEAKRRADEEAKRQAELAAAKEAVLRAETAAKEAQMKAGAEAAAAKAQADADAAAALAKAEADALKAKEEAALAEAERARKAAEALRAQLLDQFNRILETRDTPRGLVVNMGDVLFDTGKFDLRPAAREALARLTGIVLSHPTLKLEVEGHTDSTGSDELNQKLSEQRAAEVRNYLVTGGLQADTITSKGFGKTMPVEDNSTAAGRQKNRRVEIIVSGEVIGTKIGASI